MTKTRVSLNRRYLLPKEIDKNLLLATSQLATLVPNPTYSVHTVVIESKPNYEFEFATLLEWQQFASDKWTEVRKANMRISATDAFLGIGYELEQGELELRLETSTVAELDASVAAAEAILKLPLLPDNDRHAAQSLQRRYFVNAPITAEWIDGLVKAIQRELGVRPYVNARLRLVQSTAPEQSFGNLDTWRAEALRSWDDLAEIYLWISARGRRVLFDCDLRRQLLKLETEARSQNETMSLLSALVNELDLEEAPDQPYQYRRFARFFKILHWKTNSAFAGAIRAALAKGFAKPPVLVSSYITLGGSTQDLEPSSTLDAFLTRIGDATTEYDSAHLYVEGPRGKALGLSLDRVTQELAIRSSLDRKQFNQIVEEFENAIDLKLIKAVSPDKETASGKGAGEGMLAKVVIAIVGLFLSVEFIKEAIPRYNVEITFPRLQSDGIATIQSDTLHLRWLVQETRWWDTRDVENAALARLELLDTSGAVVLNRVDQSPGAGLKVAPGNYEVVVTIPALGKSARLPLRMVGKAGGQTSGI